MKNKIPFNTAYFPDSAFDFIKDAIQRKHTSGNGEYTQRCQRFFQDKYGVKKALLTTSCTDALEMSAILLNLSEGDEVIMPSFTFVSTANAFIMHGAKIIFADSSEKHPNIDPNKIEDLITEKTKAIVVVHYAGVPCDMDKIMSIALKHNIFLIEDAAQGIESKYKGQYLGTIGHLGTYSFHETKNIQCGEGGALLINDSTLIPRAEIIWEKGTNRTAFYRGEVQKYSWVDIGSSFLPSDLTSALLHAQLNIIEETQSIRLLNWNRYYENLKNQNFFKIPGPIIPECTHNAHIFYILVESKEQRDELIAFLKEREIYCVFHYLPLHLSPYYLKSHQEKSLPYSEYFADHILRLPLYHELKRENIDHVCQTLLSYFS